MPGGTAEKIATGPQDLERRSPVMPQPFSAAVAIRNASVVDHERVLP